MYDEVSQNAMSSVYNEREIINQVREKLKDDMEFEKRLEAWNAKVPVYFINIPTITYAECNDFYIKEGKKKYTRTPAYYKYEEELLEKLKKEKVTKIPEQIKYLRIDLEFMISYAQRDVDNIEKPFIDRLFKYLERDDNCLKCISKTNAIKVDEKKDEGVYFKITGITEDEFYRSKLSVQYEEQQRAKQKQRQNRKSSIRRVK